MKINVAISAHHIHLNKEDLEILFGKNYELTKYKDLSQKGQYSCVEKVKVVTLKGEMELRVLGPLRSYTQLEISKTDSIKLGINPPVRDSSCVKDSEKVTLVGPNGKIENKECCIIANRHIHLSLDESLTYGLKNDDIVSVKIDTIKGGIISCVKVKVDKSYVHELHLDTDDGNAFLLKDGDLLEIIKD